MKRVVVTGMSGITSLVRPQIKFLNNLQQAKAVSVTCKIGKNTPICVASWVVL